MPIYVNPNFQNSTPSPQPTNKHWRAKCNDWLNNHNSLLSIIIAVLFGAWGISLTIKYGDSQDQINALKDIATQQQEMNKSMLRFIKEQDITNGKLYTLASLAKEANSESRRISNSIKASMSVQAREHIERVLANVRDFQEKIGPILYILDRVTNPKNHLPTEEYKASMKRLVECCNSLTGNQIISNEGWDVEWINFTNFVTHYHQSNISNDSILNIITNPTSKKKFAEGIDTVARRVFINDSNGILKFARGMGYLPKTYAYINGLIDLNLVTGPRYQKPFQNQ